MTTQAPAVTSVPSAGGPSRLPFLIGGLVALICAQILYAALVLSALHKQYDKPMLAVRALVCDHVANRLGRMTRMGKAPERIAHLDQLLAAYADTEPDALLVLRADGTVLEGWGWPKGVTFPMPMQPRLLREGIHEFSQDGSLWLARPLLDRDGHTVGRVLLGLNDDKRSEQAWRVLRDNMRLLGAITTGACLLLVALGLTARRGKDRSSTALSEKRVYVALILPLLASQLLFSAAMLKPLRVMNETHLDAVAHQLGRHVVGEMEHLLNLGLDLEKIPPATEYLAGLQRFLPESLGVAILDAKGQRLHAADAAGPIETSRWAPLEQTSLTTDIPFGVGDIQAGSVRVLMSPLAVSANIRAITLDTLTMTVVAILFLVELTNLLILREKRRANQQLQPVAASAGFMRPVMFACMFAIDMSLSFVPLRLGELNPFLFGLPHDVIMGLPVSFEMFMVGLAIMAGGFWSERAGWRPLLVTGTVLVALGNLGSGMSTDALPYIASRGVAGAGYGLLNLAAQVFVLANSRPDQRAGNLAAVFAGLFAGALCGSASGGLIADRLGYAGAFLVAAALMTLTGLVLWRILPRQQTPAPTSARPSLPSLGETMAFIFDRRMAALLFLNIIPGAFVTVCLFQFFLPVSLNMGGASPADIGRVTMIFPLVIVYLGPLFGRLVDKSQRKDLLLALAGVIAAAGVAVLLILDGIPAAIAAVTLLGIANAILSNAQGAHALELPATTRFGAGRAMGIYNVVERLGQVLGPITLGLIIAIQGRDAGLAVMATGMAATSLILALLGQGRRGN